MSYDSDLDCCFQGGENKTARKKRVVIRTDRKRQQCKTAARSRRLTEADLFGQLTQTLPVVDQPTIYQLDRIAAVRLASMLCRTRVVAEKFLSSPTDSSYHREVPAVWTYGKNSERFSKELTTETSVDACLDGFVMVLNKFGQLLFITQSVADTLGFTQTDLIGRYLREYTHEDDWNDLRSRLCNVGSKISNSTNEKLGESSVFFRMKTALTPRGGRARKLTMAVYEPLHATIVKPAALNNGGAFDGFERGSGGGFSMEIDDEIRFMYCTPFLLSPTRRSIAAALPMITSRHELDMRFRICDEKFADALGFDGPKSLIGRSYFEFIHPEDVPNLVTDLRKVCHASHHSTGYYRLLNKEGESLWVITEMQLLVQNIRGVSQKSIICTHQFLSEVKSRLQDQTIAATSTQFLEPLPTIEPIVSEVAASKNHFSEDCPQNSTRKDAVYDDHDAQLSLAPFVPSDTLTLTQFNYDEDTSGLLPLGFEQWLGLGTQQDTEKSKATDNTISPINQMTNEFGFNSEMPLDFGDLFGTQMDVANFSIDEVERVFSEFERSEPSTLPEVQSYANLATPPASQQERSTAQDVPTIDYGMLSFLSPRPRSSSTHAPVRARPEGHRRLDEKSVETFESEMMESIRPNQSSASKLATSLDTRESYKRRKGARISGVKPGRTFVI